MLEPVFSSNDDTYAADIVDYVHQKRRTRRATRAPAATVASDDSDELSSDGDDGQDPTYTPEPLSEEAIASIKARTTRQQAIAESRRNGAIINELGDTTSGDDWPVVDTLPIATYLRSGF